LSLGKKIKMNIIILLAQLIVYPILFILGLVFLVWLGEGCTTKKKTNLSAIVINIAIADKISDNLNPEEQNILDKLNIFN
jgi:flagellar basal body-associated protein FliL